MSTPIRFLPCHEAWGKRVFALPAIILGILTLLIPVQAQTCATAGKDGTPTNALTGIVNTYYPGTATAAAGATSITLGTARGATTQITSGDLLIVIQMQDAAIGTNDASSYGDGVVGGGKGYSAANNTGRYEFVKATNTVALTGGTLNLVGTGTGSGLNNTYTNAAASGTQGQRRFQVVRVPQYVNAALSSGLTAAAWNGTTGGILAFDVSQNLILAGTVSVDGLGFRGGYGFQLTGDTGGSGTAYRDTAPTSATSPQAGFHAMKGEGFAGTPRYVWNGSSATDSGVEGYPNGSMARGAPGNAGGGGTDANPNNNDENSGGGGGANGGEGGIGGNSWTANTAVGGVGGDNFAEVSQARIVMGGGGGAGTRNNSDNITGASSGAAGGGIVIIRARKIQGTGTITANGAAAFNNTDNDGGGGGGAGGSVIVFALSSTLTGLTVNANGGRGGDAWNTQAPGGTPGERHGPGGGGGGGVIYTSSTPASRTVTAGAHGITTTAADAYGSANGVVGITGTITAGQFPGVGSGADCSASSAVDLVDFVATTDASGKVRLDWSTGYETGNLGFNIYREADGKRTQINPSLIGGSAFLGGMNTPFTAGFTYSWTDTSATESLASYWLEDVDISGKTTMHGPFNPVVTERLASRSPSLMVSQMHGESPSPTAESVSVEGFTSSMTTMRLSSQDIQTQRSIAAKPGVKFAINKPGWYHISQPDLVAAGFDVSRDPRFLQLFANGSEIAMLINGGLKGRLEPSDSIEFYAVGADTPWTSAQTYYLLNGSQAGRRVSVLPVSKGVATQRQSSMLTVERRDRFIYFSSLKNGDAENWFGSVVSTAPVDQTLTLTQVDTSATANAVLEIALQGITFGDTPASHLISVQVNGSNAGSMVFSGDLHQVNQFTISPQLLHEGTNTITLTATGGNSDLSLVDWLKLTYAHRFTADQNSLLFTASGSEAITVKGFTTPTVRVFDITDAANPLEIKATVSQQSGSYQATVAASGRTDRVLLAISDAAYQQPVKTVANVPSTWSQVSGQGADEVIITHANFRSAAEALAQRRRGQGYAVTVVDVEDLYDEFSYGERTPQAINDFLALTASWKQAPKWVLLVGDASSDPKNYLGLGDNDFVPTKSVGITAVETASDDWLADFTGDGIADLAIGRLPVRTAAQAQTVVNKIINYEQTARINAAVLVADLPGDYDFESASVALKQLLPAGLSVQEIYRSHMDDATANQALIAAINRGPKLVNYAGHGSNTIWRGNVLTTDNVPMLTNQNQLPVVVSMTCLNGLFNDPVVTSLGEALLLSDRGGAVAVWASSAQTVPGAQELMNQEMVRQLFGSGVKGSQPLTIGEAAVRAKLAAHSEGVIQTWILFGDPLMRMR